MLRIIRANIAKLPFAVDVIVNSADTEPKYNFGVDRAIYLAAGEKELLAARKIIGKIAIGDVQASDSFGLNDTSKKIFHVVAPIWSKNKSNVGKTAILRQCYQRAFDLAAKNKYSSIACPILASGNNGLEIKEAVQIAIEESLRFLFNHDSFEVCLVVLDKETLDICSKILPVKSYIKDKEVKALIAAEKAAGADHFRENQPSRPHVELEMENSNFIKMLADFMKKFRHPSRPEHEFSLSNTQDLKDILHLGNISDRVFYSIYPDSVEDNKSKRVLNKEYHPLKNIAVRFAFALRLTVEEATELLNSAGYTLTVKDDYCRRVMDLLDRKIYDMMTVEKKLPELKNTKDK